jgi:hypothetical protein
VGALTIVGPDASQASAKKLASQAYAYARVAVLADGWCKLVT